MHVAKITYWEEDGGWIGYLIAGFIGACILIFAGRAIRRTT